MGVGALAKEKTSYALISVFRHQRFLSAAHDVDRPSGFGGKDETRPFDSGMPDELFDNHASSVMLFNH